MRKILRLKEMEVAEGRYFGVGVIVVQWTFMRCTLVSACIFLIFS